MDTKDKFKTIIDRIIDRRFADANLFLSQLTREELEKLYDETSIAKGFVIRHMEESYFDHE